MKNFGILLVIAMSSVLLAFTTSGQEKTEPIKTITQDNVAIKVYDFEGLKQYFTKHNDTTYVINFWSTWCKPCVKEMPHFEEFSNEMSDEKFKLIFVSLDFPEVYENQLVAFLKLKGLESECVVLDDPDANAWIGQVDESWSGAIPATVIYRGKERFFHEGYMAKDKLIEEVKKKIKHTN
jgi:thiol-disulfide isomerase/thioredoxin